MIDGYRLRRAHAVEAGGIAGGRRVGELILARRVLHGHAQNGPVGEWHGQVGGAQHGEAQAGQIGKARVERAARRLPGAGQAEGVRRYWPAEPARNYFPLGLSGIGLLAEHAIG